MITPRPYLSFSQLATFEMSPQRYADQYLYGKKIRISRNIAYGAKMAEGLEAEEATGDPILDLMMSKIPKFELMDKVVEDNRAGVPVYDPHSKQNHLVPALKDGKQLIPLLAKPDTATVDYSAFKEYKTSVQNWTQERAADSGQITFYATAIYLVTLEIPKDIELVNVRVDYQDDGSIAPTGEILRFRTERRMIDILKMTKRIKECWRKIGKLCEDELL